MLKSDKYSMSFVDLLKRLDKTLIYLKKLLKIFPKPNAGKREINNILIIKMSAMGDALCLMPAIRELKKFIPNAKITWLTSQRTNPELFTNLWYIDRIKVMRLSLGGIYMFLKDIFTDCRYDLIIDFDQYYQLSEILSFLLCEVYSIGFKTEIKGTLYDKTIEYNPLKNEKLMFYDLVLLAIGKTINFYDLDVRLPGLINRDKSVKVTSIIGKLKEHNKKLIGIYPGSSKNAIFRRWPLERYLEVGNYFMSNGYFVVFIGGEDEIECKKDIANFYLDKTAYLDLIGELSITELPFIIKELNLLIGNDAGILHFADAVGIKSISIFGPNRGNKWGPLKNSIVLEKTIFDCKPCIINYKGKIPSFCKMGDVRCLMSISVDEVINSALKLLECES